MTSSWSILVFEQFQQFLVEVSGLFFSIDRSQSLTDKVSERMKACHISDPLDYLAFLKSGFAGIAECKNLLDGLTIGETFFFRNQPQFEALRSSVLPKLFQKKKAHIWCAGCSTGEEPYSIAIELCQMLPDLQDWDISILATDVNRNSLDAARRGVYRSRATQLVPPDILNRYFKKAGDGYQISDDIRRMVTFQYHNLATEPFNLPGMLDLDILFCRNVTIYFDLPTLKRIIAQFSDCLVPGGILFIGHAETLWGISDMFQPIEFPNTFLYERLVAPLPPVQFVLQPMPLPSPEPAYVPPVPAPQPVFHPVEVSKVETPHLAEWLEKGTALANEGHYQKALEYLQKVVAQDNLQAGAYHLMGVVFTKLQRYTEAIKEFRRALYCDSEFAVCHFHLGNLFRMMGEQQQAKKEYQHCLMALAGKEDADAVPFSEGLTVGVLAQAVRQAQETVIKS